MIVAGYRVLPLGSTSYSRPSRQFESPVPPRSPRRRNRYSYSDDDEPSANDLTDKPTLAESTGDSLQGASLSSIQPSTREHPRAPASIRGDIRTSEVQVRPDRSKSTSRDDRRHRQAHEKSESSGDEPSNDH